MYFVVVIEQQTEDDKGKIKPKKHQFLVKAESNYDANVKASKEWEGTVSGDWQIIDVKKSQIEDVYDK